MAMRKEIFIDNKRYLATKRVKFLDRVFQKYWCANPHDVDVVFFNEDNNIQVKDTSLLVDLMKKFCITSELKAD